MLQKYFEKNNIRKHLFITLFKTLHKSRRRNRAKISEIHLNWKLTNTQLKIQCEWAPAGWLIIPVEEQD